MAREYWQRQTSEKPLFADVLWSRPENRNLAGKLLIAGGNLYGFAAPAESVSNSSESRNRHCASLIAARITENRRPGV